MYKTLEGVLEPSGKIELDEGKVPDHPVRIMLTILEAELSERDKLVEIGDYLHQVELYEEKLAKGDIRWK